MRTAEEHLNIALGGNMNISTLKPKAWHEIMTNYAKHYHKEATNDSKPTLEEIEEIIEQYTFGDDEWGGSKLAEWRYGTNVVVGGITEAAEEILKRLA